ncbi:hypothetical protein ACLOBS_06945 [Limosilactobacillus mucosae]|uniref:hypothetical protein n=1 Tax=Limosilactobacillus mucosae TaxID=97478 RepID=UPI003EB8442A
MIFDKDEFEKILGAEHHLFDAALDLSRATQEMELDEIIDDLDAVEYQALSAILAVKEVKAVLGVQKDEN